VSFVRSLQQLINNYTLMKKATRLLILTAFVLPLSLIGSAYAGGPGPGQRTPFSGFNHSGTRHVVPYYSPTTPEGFEPGQGQGYDPYRFQDPIGDPREDVYRNDLYHHLPVDAGRQSYDPNPTGSGGGTAPIDGGISLLVAAGIGLGLRKARSRKQSV
jgi:hypothetical protein